MRDDRADYRIRFSGTVEPLIAYISTISTIATIVIVAVGINSPISCADNAGNDDDDDDSDDDSSNGDTVGRVPQSDGSRNITCSSRTLTNHC